MKRKLFLFAAAVVSVLTGFLSLALLSETNDAEACSVTLYYPTASVSITCNDDRKYKCRTSIEVGGEIVAAGECFGQLVSGTATVITTPSPTTPTPAN